MTTTKFSRLIKKSGLDFFGRTGFYTPCRAIAGDMVPLL